MRSVTWGEYHQFLDSHGSITIENNQIRLSRARTAGKSGPDNFVPEAWTIWRFPDRGNWATHAGDYRGNWSPYIPRNLIHKFTVRGDSVCDPMVGSGTTLVECKLTGRRGIGVDTNLDAVMVAMNRLDFEPAELCNSPFHRILSDP